MGDKSKIEWTEATWNPLAGCSLVSPGCKNCYAMSVANRLLDKPGSHYHGTTERHNGKAVWTGKINLAPGSVLEQPYRWKRPRMVFVNSMSDMFHEDVPDGWIMNIWRIMAENPQHTFQILTKRPERMREFMKKWADVNYEQQPVMAEGPAAIRAAHTEGRAHLFAAMLESWGEVPAGSAYPFYDWMQGPKYWPEILPNIWLGTTVEDQRRANERIRHLLNTPAAVRFLSMEPLLEAVDLNNICSTALKDDGKVPMVRETALYNVADRPAILPLHDAVKLDWVILGGESGPDARPMHPDWVRLTRDQCETAHVPFFFKQWGRWAPLLPEHEGRGDWFIVDRGGGVDIPDDRWPDEELGEVAMLPVGKKAGGRFIDGRTWDQMPKREWFQ